MYKTLVLTQNSQPFPIALRQLELQCDFPGQTHTTLGQQGASLDTGGHMRGLGVGWGVQGTCVDVKEVCSMLVESSVMSEG